MGKLIAIVVAALVAAGGTYGLVSYTDMFGCKAVEPVDPADCPVVKAGGCPFCNDASPVAGSEACAADAGTVARAIPSDGHAAVAVAGPAGLFLPTGKKSAKVACCCCEEESSGGLAAVAGAVATVRK